MDSMQLRIFVTLAENLNFTRTAAILYTSQSHVSKQIAKLEKEWGIQLFERSRHGVALTPAGQCMQQYAANTIQQFESAIAQAKKISESSCARLRIGIMNQINFRPGPGLIRGMRAEFPNARISMEFGEEEALMSMLWDNALDVIITSQDALTHQAQVCWQELMFGTWHISISNDNLPADHTANLNWLRDEALITVHGSMTISLRNLLENMHIKYGFVPLQRLEAPNAEAMYRMVESGMGYGFVEEVPQNTPVQPRLAFIDTGIAYSIGLVWKPDAGNPLIDRFVESSGKIWTQEASSGQNLSIL